MPAPTQPAAPLAIATKATSDPVRAPWPAAANAAIQVHIA